MSLWQEEKKEGCDFDSNFVHPKRQGLSRYRGGCCEMWVGNGRTLLSCPTLFKPSLTKKSKKRKEKKTRNKLASLEATLVVNYHPLTYSLTGVRCRATSVAKNGWTLLSCPTLFKPSLAKKIKKKKRKREKMAGHSFQSWPSSPILKPSLAKKNGPTLFPCPIWTSWGVGMLRQMTIVALNCALRIVCIVLSCFCNNLARLL